MDRHDVVITGFRLNATEQPSKVLQRLLGLDEALARTLAKRFPSVVRSDEPRAEAERLMLALRDAGAYVHLREASERSEPAALFRNVSDDAARVSHYKLGELEVVVSQSQPAPAMLRADALPSVETAPSQPAPRAKSQPAPASKSQPAPAGKSQPAPAVDPGLASGGLRMFGDNFGDQDAGDGSLLELDERALGRQTNRVEVVAWRKEKTEDVRKRRGFFATLLLPLVLMQTALPTALALTGVAAASGAAVYMVRRSDQAKEASTEAGASRDFEGQAQPDYDAAGDATSASIAPATHPLVRLAPQAMEGSIASILRSRIRGVHKVGIKWEEGTKPTGAVECMLLEQAEVANLKELASTGKVVQVPSAVRVQLQDHMLTLRTADGNPNAAYLPICLAN